MKMYSIVPETFHWKPQKALEEKSGDHQRFVSFWTKVVGWRFCPKPSPKHSWEATAILCLRLKQDKWIHHITSGSLTLPSFVHCFFFFFSENWWQNKVILAPWTVFSIYFFFRQQIPALRVNLRKPNFTRIPTGSLLNLTFMSL